MNIHHLELFYYVARHGGIMEAVRNIPYGIQQPAVSGQVAQLEQYLGVVLFQRRPFALAAAGDKLYRFIRPFFTNLQEMAAELQGGQPHHVRIGASTMVLRDHLPDFFRNVRKKFSTLKITLREGYQPDLEALLQREELDLAITLIEKKSASGIHSTPLLGLTLALLVPKESPITSAAQLWKTDRIEEPLICLPASEGITRHFRQGLNRLDIDWFPSIEVSSIDLIQTYVAGGFGVGVTVVVPKSVLPPTLRPIALPASVFPQVVVGALWRGKLSPLLQSLVGELRLKAKSLS